MRAIVGSVVGLVAAIAAAGTLAGCGDWSINSGHEFEDDRTETATVHEVRLAGGDGAVTVSRGSGTVTQIHRKVWYRDTKPTGRQDRLEGTTLLLDTRCGRTCSVSYTVTVPAQVNVTGHLDTGPIDLTAVGTVDVDTNDGSIEVRDAAGTVAVRTDTGPIHLSSVAGTITARTHDGSITVRTGAKAVTAQTDTGPISVTDVAGTIAARTSDGSISLDRVAGAVSAETDTGPIDGRGLGGPRTTARTSDGSITLTLSTAQDVVARTDTGPIMLMVPRDDSGYRIQTRTTTGPTTVNVANNPAGARSLSLSSNDGSITVNPA
jgi:DUF4097 and DUF4098 domain-containing protein YvlB